MKKFLLAVLNIVAVLLIGSIAIFGFGWIIASLWNHIARIVGLSSILWYDGLAFTSFWFILVSVSKINIFSFNKGRK